MGSRFFSFFQSNSKRFVWSRTHSRFQISLFVSLSFLSLPGFLFVVFKDCFTFAHFLLFSFLSLNVIDVYFYEFSFPLSYRNTINQNESVSSLTFFIYLYMMWDCISISMDFCMPYALFLLSLEEMFLFRVCTCERVCMARVYYCWYFWCMLLLLL